MIGDNGKNFIEADRELKKFVAMWNKERIEEQIAQKGIRWKFNPPAAPRLIGLWDLLVISSKKAMYAVLGKRLTDFLKRMSYQPK